MQSYTDRKIKKAIEKNTYYSYFPNFIQNLLGIRRNPHAIFNDAEKYLNKKGVQCSKANITKLINPKDTTVFSCDQCGSSDPNSYKQRLADKATKKYSCTFFGLVKADRDEVKAKAESYLEKKGVPPKEIEGELNCSLNNL